MGRIVTQNTPSATARLTTSQVAECLRRRAWGSARMVNKLPADMNHASNGIQADTKCASTGIVVDSPC